MYSSLLNHYTELIIFYCHCLILITILANVKKILLHAMLFFSITRYCTVIYITHTYTIIHTYTPLQTIYSLSHSNTHTSLMSYYTLTNSYYIHYIHCNHYHNFFTISYFVKLVVLLKLICYITYTPNFDTTAYFSIKIR